MDPAGVMGIPDFWERIIRNYEEEVSPQPVINGKTGAIPDFEDLPSDGRKGLVVGFVDGGNCTIFSAPNFLLAKVRIGYAIFSGRKKLKEDRKDYDVKCYFEDGWVADYSEGIIKIETKDLLDGGRENTDRIPQLVRRILEIRMADSLVRSSQAGFVVLDGTLDGTFESEELSKLSPNVVALSKTNTIRTVKGNSYTGLLAKLGPETFVCKNVLPDISFVKLNRSPYVFRIDGILDDDLLFWLVEHAKDPAILGYPYGLIVADRVARIPDYEVKSLRVKSFTSLGGKSSVIRELLAGRDIHEFLDGNNIY